ncbi:hypothetical protein HU200_061437 [Digitaria exilis]|uniref:Uncharacterized protein n=1 Tax=Digitaria exilis TaxID=1010633 RepID=A0A835A4L3_9POAL|nr:hypothetical protein HU200_061437 [Digitaria exilis]
MFFAANGTSIITAHPRNDYWNAPDILPIIDVSTILVRFGPGLDCPARPIFIAVVGAGGDEKAFALDMGRFAMLLMKPPCSPDEWSWCGNGDDDHRLLLPRSSWGGV